MRSKTVIIGDEKQEDFDRLAAGWRAEYDDDGQATKSLLERVILNDWFWQRAERRYMELECELAAVDALEWTDEDHKKIELYLRYKTTNERSFYRALNALRGLRKDKIREVMDFKKMEKRAEEAVQKALERKSAEQQAQPEPKPKPMSRGNGMLRGQDTWLEVIEREAARGTGDVGPTGVRNLTRPKERGGCDCEVCARNREVLERRAAKGE